jgi:hypothetical protein
VQLSAQSGASLYVLFFASVRHVDMTCSAASSDFVINVIINILNLFSPINYQVAFFWQVQISATDQSDFPRHFTDALCSAHCCGLLQLYGRPVP